MARSPSSSFSAASHSISITGRASVSARPSSKAIGAAELVAYLKGEIDLDTARERGIVLTRQYAKRQRTWFRARMRDWTSLTIPGT